MKPDKNVYSLFQDCTNDLLVELHNYEVESEEYKQISNFIAECRAFASSVANSIEESKRDEEEKYKTTLDDFEIIEVEE